MNFASAIQMIANRLIVRGIVEISFCTSPASTDHPGQKISTTRQCPTGAGGHPLGKPLISGVGGMACSQSMTGMRTHQRRCRCGAARWAAQPTELRAGVYKGRNMAERAFNKAK